jgi:hypothetical protein
MSKPDELALQGQYGDLYNEIVRPERKYTISHYLRTQWAPLLGAARLWFIVALRQRCFWNNKQDWCIVDKETLARESGLSLRTVNRIIAATEKAISDGSRDDWTTLFFSKTRRRRYNQYVGRTVNAPNRYHVLIDDPLTPAHQAALSEYVRKHTKDGTPQDTLRTLQALCACSGVELDEILSAPTPEAASSPPSSSGFVLDLVQAHCPLPPRESALYAEIARAASRLHNAITTPERVYIGNQYFRLHWLPELGPVLSSLVVNLRARCYWNERTRELRDSCRATWSQLARELGCTARQLRNLRQKPYLEQFVTVLSEGHGRALSEFRMNMFDPLTDSDRQRFEAQARTTADVLVDPETGQLDIYPLLAKTEDSTEERRAERKTNKDRAVLDAEGMAPRRASQAETLAGRTGETGDISSTSPDRAVEPTREAQASSTPQPYNRERTALSDALQREGLAPSTPSQAEVLAASGGKFLHLEGIKAEVLAVQSGNSGTTVKLRIITPTMLRLEETILAVDQDISTEAQLLAAARDVLFAQLDIQEPNRTKIAARHPRCDWIVAWGLYALTQPGLSQNRAGYICNRLSNGDLPPSEFLELSGLPPPVWGLFRRAERLGDETLIPVHLHRPFRRWQTLLAEACGGLSPRSSQDEEDDAASWHGAESRPADAPRLPGPVQRLLQGMETVEHTPEGIVIATPDLYQAYCLARSAAGHAWDGQIAVEVIGPGGERYPLNAEVLALAVESLPADQWEIVWQELQWQMDRSVFLRWWRGVKPLGVLRQVGADMPCVVLGVPEAEVRTWIEARHLPIVARTMSGVLGRTVEVRFEIYAQIEPVSSPVAQ